MNFLLHGEIIKINEGEKTWRRHEKGNLGKCYLTR